MLSCNGLYNSSFSALFTPVAGQESELHALIQGRQYLNKHLTAARAEARYIQAILRTPVVHVDRSTVAVAYQLRDTNGNVQVETQNLAVEFTLTASTAITLTVACDANLQKSTHYLGHCSLSVPASWYSADIVGHGTLTVRYASRTVATHNLEDVIQVVEAPLWYHNLDSAFNSATAFGVLPASPVYKGETFSLHIYAHTGGNALSTFWVWVTIDATAIAYHSFTQSPFHQTATLSYGGAYNEVLRFAAVGLLSGITDAMVISPALLLLSVDLSLLPSVVSELPSGITIYARQFVNPGSHAYLENSNGWMFDSRNVATSEGRVVMEELVDRGIFAYADSSALVNMAALTGRNLSYPLTVLKTHSNASSNEYYAVIHNTSCSSRDDGIAFSLIGCEVSVTSAHTSGVPSTTVIVATALLSATVPISVFFPFPVSIEMDDMSLDRLYDASGGPVVLSSGNFAYQWTNVHASIELMDITPLVAFEVTENAIATLLGDSAELAGVSPGSTEVHLKGRPLSFASANVTVRATAVTAAGLIARVVTTVTWVEQPPETIGPDAFTAAVLVEQQLLAEQAFGLLFASITWSDGTVSPVRHAGPSEELLNLTTLSTNIMSVPPGSSENGEQFWLAQVPIGASKESGDLMRATLSINGHFLAASFVPIFVNVPEPVSMLVGANVERLAPLLNDATATPVGVSSSAQLWVRVYYSDGTSRDLSSDSRIVFLTGNAKCASTSGRDLNVVAEASCTFVDVNATFAQAGLAAALESLSQGLQ